MVFFVCLITSLIDLYHTSLPYVHQVDIVTTSVAVVMSVKMAPPLPLIFLLMIPDVFSAGWGVSYSHSHICALKNSSVIMSCTYTYPTAYQIKNVFWTKGPFINGEEPPDLSNDTEYSQRLQYLGDKHHTCTIRLNHVTQKDEHEYCFRFTTDKTDGKWTGDPGVSLTVTDLQVESPERVTEGDSVRLTCNSSCTLTDRATFIWYRNSQPLTERRDRNNELLLQSVRREDAGRYSCALHGHTYISPAVHLNVMYAPKTISVSISPSGEIVEGDSVTLNCSSDSNPPAEISWFRGGTFVGSGRIYSISNISSDHSGEYKCKSRNEHGEKYSDAVALNIMYPPKSISVSISPSGEIVEGDSVTLNCSSDSNPPAEISWFKGGMFVGSGRIYNISKISSDHSGEYKCKSINKHGEKYSDAVTLNVMYPPRNVSGFINGSAEIEEGDSVTLICSSDSNPPAEISWFKEDESSAVGSGQSFSALQSGRFYCEAHNQHGSQRSDAVTVNVHGRTFLYVVGGVTGGLGGLIFIFIIVLLLRKKHRPDDITQKQDDLYANASAHDGPRSESDPPDQNDALYSLITLNNFSGYRTVGKTSDSEDTEEIQYVTILHHRNKGTNHPEDDENHYDNIGKYQPHAARRSTDQMVEDQSVIYSTVK
ncbi:B-cell receptor CD22-like isoform X3 [Labeo rohita]|uniref:B-cell receptor CD22-like isoform X3 n=1 Tax=Labeo rohita TaxID=84645 RepID=UPI0021E2C216|nr:B-cell receptor CD22-like isoform X3 [Labeo rohita]